MKKSFTLLEVLISIFLLSLIVTFLSQSMSSLEINRDFFSKKNIQSKQNYEITKVLYDDILTAKSLNFKNYKDYAILYLNTQNSLYNIDYPYVIWYVAKKNDTLCRIESIQKFTLPLNNEDIYKINLSKIKKECKKFNIYASKDKKNIILYLQFDKEEPIFFSIYNPALKK